MKSLSYNKFKLLNEKFSADYQLCKRKPLSVMDWRNGSTNKRTCLSNLTISVQSQKLKVEEKKQVLKIILLLWYPHSPQKIKQKYSFKSWNQNFFQNEVWLIQMHTPYFDNIAKEN